MTDTIVPITVMLDDGHGMETLGKRSPDGSLRENECTSDIVNMIKAKLDDMGIPCILIAPEDDDVSLVTRVRRANDTYYKHKDAILISVHLDAYTDNWNNAKGWSVFVYNRASDDSKLLANMMYDAAQAEGFTMRPHNNIQKYREAGYYILKYSACPAILTENLFMTNKSECEFLKTKEGRQKIADLHVRGILKYIDKKRSH